jgi:hypothetical protein
MQGELYASEGMGVSGRVRSDGGRGDWRPCGESKVTVFGPFCFRRIVRVSYCPAGSLLRLYGGEKMGEIDLQRGGA